MCRNVNQIRSPTLLLEKCCQRSHLICCLICNSWCSSASPAKLVNHSGKPWKTSIGAAPAQKPSQPPGQTVSPTVGSKVCVHVSEWLVECLWVWAYVCTCMCAYIGGWLVFNQTLEMCRLRGIIYCIPLGPFLSGPDTPDKALRRPVCLNGQALLQRWAPTHEAGSRSSLSGPDLDDMGTICSFIPFVLSLSIHDSSFFSQPSLSAVSLWPL